MTAPRCNVCGSPAPDNGLALALTLAKDDLDELRDYFRERMDASDEGCNAEMNLFNAVTRIQVLHARIIEGRTPLPRHGYTALGAEPEADEPIDSERIRRQEHADYENSRGIDPEGL